MVALKRAQAHRGARASPELLYHLIFLLLSLLLLSYAIFIVVHKYICITHRFLHVSILFVYFFPCISCRCFVLCLYLCANPRFILCIFYSTLLLLLCFSCAHPNVVSIIFILIAKKNVIHFSFVFFLFSMSSPAFFLHRSAQKDFYHWKMLTFRKRDIEKYGTFNGELD